MAFNDTLFQLGMDLTRSSPAQEEDLVRAPVAMHKEPISSFVERQGVRYAGQHLLVDLFGARKLDDVEHVERTLQRCVEAAGATLLHMHVHPLKPTGGVTGVAVLAESHISVHTWPESGYAAFDVFMGGAANPERAVHVLREAFGADNVVVKTHLRGEDATTAVRDALAVTEKRQPARVRNTRKAKVAA